jgi:hypothetical protein
MVRNVKLPKDDEGGKIDRGGELRITGRRWQIHVLVVLAYILLALVLTWPVAGRLSTHVPGNGADDPPLTWNLWWVRYALLEAGANPFDSDYMFYPLGINLAFYTLTILNGLLSIPLQAAFGLVAASNLLLLLSFVLGAYGAFLLSLFLLGRRMSEPGVRGSNLKCLLPAFLAGLIYAFASSKMAYAALGQWNIASSQWIPFYVLYLFKMAEQPRRWRHPLMAGLFLLLQAYAELTYASFLVLFTGLWAIWWCLVRLRSWRWPEFGRFVANLLLVALLFVVGLLPVLAMMIPDLLLEGDIFVLGSGFADVFSADLLGFLVPTMYHPLLGSLVQQMTFDHTVGQHIFLGYTAVALALAGLVLWWKSRDYSGWVKFWLLSALIAWLLTLGPTLRVNGLDSGLPLPFAIIAKLPFFKGNRYPSRYSVLLVLSLAMLASFGLAGIIDRLQRRSHWAGRRVVIVGITLLLAVLLLFEHLSVPLPMSDMRVPVVYQQIADEMPGDFALLDLPVAWRNGFRVTGTQHPIIMFEQYYQTVHGKRILAGNTSRNPPLKFQYFTEAPVLNTLIALETGHEVDPATVERDRALAPEVLRFFDIGVVIVHPDQAGPEVIPYVEETMPVDQFYTDPETGIIAYKVLPLSWPSEWTVEPGEPLAGLSYAEGWGEPANGMIWAQRRKARLLVPLHFAALHPARGVQLSPRAIGQTDVESPVNLVVQSAGQEVGDFGHIYVDGQDVAPDRRGYNIAVIHPESGAVEAVAVFDTHLDDKASRNLAAFLSGVPEGYIVAVAVADEASRLLGEDAVAALRGIGATGDLQDKFRWGQAIVGVQGAAPGTALEVLDWMRPVTLVVGEGATEPDLAAAFGTIVVGEQQ